MNQLMGIYRNRRIRIVFFTVIGCYLCYTLFAGLLLPRILHRLIEEKAGEALASRVSLQSLSINPFRLSITAGPLSVTRPEEQQPWISWDTLHVNAKLASVFTLGIHLDELRMINPALLLELKPQKEEPIADPPHDTAQTFSEQFAARGQLRPMSIDQFAMRGGTVTLIDLRGEKAKKLTLSPIAFSLENFSTRFRKAGNNQYDLRFSGPEGGLFRWTGNLEWQPFLSTGEMEIQGLDLAQFRDFYPDSLLLRPLAGELGIQMHYRLSEEPGIGFEMEDTRLKLSHLRLGSGEEREAQITLDSLTVGPVRISSHERNLHVERVSLNNLWLHHALRPSANKSTGTDLSFILYDSTAQDSLTDGMDPFAVFLTRVTHLARWQLRVDSVALNRITIDISDSLVVPGTRHRIENLNINLGALTNRSEDSLSYALAGTLNEKGHLSVKGRAALFPLRISAQAALDSFPLVTLQPYITSLTTAQIRQGLVSARLHLGMQLAAQRPDQDSLRIGGDVELRNLAVDALADQRLVNLERLSLQGMESRFPENQIRISSITLQKPSVWLRRDADGKLSVDNLLRNSSEKRASPEDPDAEPLRLNIGSVRMERASVQLADFTFASPFLFRVDEMDGVVRRLSNHQKMNGTFEIRGKLDGYAPISVTGITNLTGRYPRVEVSLSSRTQELVPYSPYAGRYAGYRISKGQMETNLHYRIADNELKGENHIVIRQLTFGEAVESPEATRLPVRLGVALLSDRDGIIDLDVGISGRMDDPEFSVGGMIWKVVQNLIGKAAAAPMKALMALGGSEEDLQNLPFAVGSADLNPQAATTLQRLAQALAQRPGIELEIQGSLDSVNDQRMLRERQLIRELAVRHRVDSLHISDELVRHKPLRDTLFLHYGEKLRKDWKNVLRSVTENDTMRYTQPRENDLQLVAENIWKELLASQETSAAQAWQLATLRAQNVKAALIHADTSLATRIYVLEGADTTRQGSVAWLRLRAR